MVELVQRVVAAGLIAGAVVLGTAATATAEEEIRDFRVAIDVTSGGDIEVTERIEVRAEQHRIKRGIFRDLPQLRSFGPLPLRLPIEVVRVSRDGSAEPHRIENTADGIRIYVGRPDRVLEAGVYTYELVYRSRGQLGYFDDHDELFWNVTGHQWELPIARASVEVRLPEGIAAGEIDLTAFTGPPGSERRDAELEVDPAGVVRVSTSRALPPGEGLTIVTGWPRGHVAAPGFWERAGWLFRGWAQVMLGDTLGKLLMAVTLGLLALYLVTWLIWGREPARGPIEAQLAPPAGITAAEALVLDRMAWSPKALSATLIDFAVRGKLSLEETEPGSWSLCLPAKSLYEMSREQRKALLSDLLPREREVLEALFSEGPRVALGPSGQRPLMRAMLVLHKATEESTKELFSSPLSFFGDGIHMPLLAVPIASGLFLFLTMIVSIGTGLAGLLTWAVAAVLQVTAALLWRRALRRRTAAGRRIMDQLEGLRRGLRSDSLGGVEVTERLLPYAVALGAESAWADKIDREIRSAVGPMSAGSPGYQPAWMSASYLGTSILAPPHAICRTLEGALAPSARMPSTGSSSGGGGGGVSSSGFSSGSGVGDGGGGGGGGGW